MNIRYIKSNISKIPEDNLIRFLYDLILDDLNNITSYEPGIVYTKGDRVYLQENGKHQIFQCSVDKSSSSFNYDEWEYVLEVFNNEINKFYNLKIKDEVHIIDEFNRNQITTKLEFNENRSTFALYCGKKRYSNNYDFTISGNNIIFKEPFNIGDRVILEVRESTGQNIVIGAVFYDLNKIPYNVYINEHGIINIEKHHETTANDVKYTELVTGDMTYTLLVDGGSEPYELKAYQKIETYITGTNGDIYNVKVIDDTLSLIKATPGNSYSDTRIILGLDNKFYTLDLIGDQVVANEVFDESLNPANFDMGVKVITENFENRIICIDNGEIKILPYICNNGYHNINFIDRTHGDIVRLTINENNELEMYDGLETDGDSGTRLLDYFYFFDNEWNYNRMFVENGNLLFEPCGMEVIPDSRGINLLKPDGEMFKLMIPHVGEGIHIVKCINIVNRGTFESPIEGFVVKIDGETKLVTVNKETNGFEIVDTDLPFRTNFHYIMSTDNRLYRLSVENNKIAFIENVEELDNTINYIDAGDGTYYYLNEYDGELEIVVVNDIPAGSIVGEVIVEYNSNKYKLIYNDGPVFEKVDSSHEGFEYVSCLNNGRVCHFSLDEFAYCSIGTVEIIGEYNVESIITGAYIKSNEMITRFDIVDGECVFNPISTFVHRVKSENGNAYLIDVVGEPYNEILTINDMNEAYNNLGTGHLYLADINNNHYRVSIGRDEKFKIDRVVDDYFVDYNVSSLIDSSQGLYKIYVEDDNIKLEKVFDNMYYHMLSYGNIVKKSFEIQASNGVWYSLAANGLGEIIVDKVEPTVNISGIVLKSDDGYNYGLGVIGDKLVTYRTFIINSDIKDNILLKDISNNENYKLFMNGDRLCSSETNEDAIQNHVVMVDAYQNEFKLEFENEMLKVTLL